MPERNLCTESGCKAYCCFGPEFPPLKIDQEQIFRWFPQAKQTFSIGFVTLINKKGVHYRLSGNEFIIKVVGYCPNLDKNFNCRLEGESKPGPCAKFALGQEGCDGTRLTYLLPTYREWRYQQTKALKEIPKVPDKL